MNLRTHTYLIPVLCGGTVFAALVASDLAIRQLRPGAEPERTTRLAEASTPMPSAPAALPVAVAPVAAPAPDPETVGEIVAAGGMVGAVPVEPAVTIAGAGGVPDAELTGAAEPEVAEARIAAPPEEAPAAVPAPEPEAEATEAADDNAAGQAGMTVRAAAEPAGFGATCTVERGFKRCRIGD